MISLTDRLELQDLHSRYVHAIDRGDLAMLRTLYTDDATERHGDYEGGVDGFLAWLEPVLNIFEIATHAVTNLLACVEGDEAESEARAVAYLRVKGEPPVSLIVVNRHFDRYRRVDGRWRFARRSVIVDWAEVMPTRESPLDMVRPFPKGTTGKDDPLYGEVPRLVRALRREAGCAA